MKISRTAGLGKPARNVCFFIRFCAHLFYCVLVCLPYVCIVCGCVCACTARCGLSLSFEVQLFGEALCAVRPKAMFGHKRNELMPS